MEDRDRMYSMEGDMEILKEEGREKYIADTFEKVGLAEIVREQGNDTLTNAVQSAMIELSKAGNTVWGEDERIRKEIIEYLWDISNQTPLVKESLDCRRWIAWLEMQKDLVYRLAVIQKVSFHPLVMQTKQEWSEGYIR